MLIISEKELSIFNQYDAPWKNALQNFLKEFMEFCYPIYASEIDWTRGYVSLEQELNNLIPASYRGKGEVDKLFRLYLKNGREQTILVANHF